MSTDRGRPVEILLVEDNAGDVRLTREALRDAHITGRLHVVADGEQALAFLRRAAPYADAPVPDVVLLDLNLPRKHGHEVLAEMKSDPALRPIPVIVLSSSQAERDIATSYRLHANCYVTKPADFDRFTAVVRSIHDFWFTVAALPEAT